MNSLVAMMKLWRIGQEANKHEVNEHLKVEVKRLSEQGSEHTCVISSIAKLIDSEDLLD